MRSLSHGIATFLALRSARASSHWSPARLASHQLHLLQHLLFHAYQYVPFYRQHFDAHSFHPSSLTSLDHLPLIPLLTKQHLRQHAPDFFLAAGIAPHTCQTVATSGSSGAPLRILLDPPGQRAHRVAAWRILFEHGFRWTDHTVEIRMTTGPVHPVQRLGLAPKTWLSLLDSPASWHDTLNRLRPQVLVAGASTLYALAAAGPPLAHSPRLIISDSETLYPTHRALIHSRLGANPIDVYGLVELSNFAWECELRNGFHLSADSHLVEIIDNEIVATHLDQTGFPIIRYRTGDLADPSPTPCPCGRPLPLLRHIHGRAIDSVTLPSGQTLFWPFFHEILALFPQLQQWRVLQTEPHAIRLQLVTTPNHLPAILSALEARLPEPLHIQPEILDAIPLAPGEKFRAILRQIPV